MAPRASTVAPSRQASPSREPSPTPDEEEEPFFDMVEELQAHGINAQDIAKLKSASLNTVSSVKMTSRRNLLKIKGLSDAKVDKIKEAVLKITGSSFCTGVQVAEKRQRVVAISTGSKAVDAILGGGIHTQSISEGKSSHFFVELYVRPTDTDVICSIWGVSDGKDAAGAYDERTDAASRSSGRRRWKGGIY
ncbi:hypothetical protein BOTBODRAFT_169925 [Botryobasidium botryosum FD-172 SS1]|uniref:Rad51-like C-terminal domain-containing protein n=1 Tax=Botryobasidium botryosum (strain FD-172 SS1) TaxID=930990 RepID=A0A067MYX4_BOTB1|nr:hypothetical protein BOTBODRAFT_169925 [Botryobasidium botryosum FD-172 SS1]